MTSINSIMNQIVAVKFKLFKCWIPPATNWLSLLLSRGRGTLESWEQQLHSHFPLTELYTTTHKIMTERAIQLNSGKKTYLLGSNLITCAELEKNDPDHYDINI